MSTPSARNAGRRNDPIEQMITDLLEAGWTKWEGRMTVWKSPKGHLFRGPVKAHEIMLKDWEKTL